MEAAWLMTDNDRYALMHKKDIRICRSTLDASFVVQLSLHERMNFPEFSLLLCDRRHPEIEASVRSVSREELPNFRKRLRRLLSKWSEIKSFGFVAELVYDRLITEIVDVRIRVEHADTSWRFGQIEKIHPRNEFMMVRREAYVSPVASK